MRIKYNRETELYEAHIDGFPAGVNKYDDIVRPGQATDAQNLFLDGSKRGGSAKVNASAIGASAILGLAPYYKVGTSSKWLMAKHGTVAYRWTGTAWESVKTGLTTAYEMEFQPFNALAYAVDGKDGYFQYDGTTFAAVTPVVATADEIAAVGDNVLKVGSGINNDWQFIFLLDNYLMVGGSSDHPSRVYFTYIDEATLELKPGYIPAKHRVDFRTNDNEGLIAGLTYGGDGILFKESSLFRLLGSTRLDFRPYRVEGAKGTPARRSPAIVKHLLFYLTKDEGVYGFDGNTPTKILSDLDTVFDSINQTYIAKSCATEWDGKYLLAIPEGTDTVNKTVIVYDPKYQGYAILRYPFGITAFCKYKFSDTEVLCAAGADGIVYKLFTTDTDDAGTTIDAYVEFTVGLENTEFAKRPIKSFPTCDGKIDNLSVICTVGATTYTDSAIGTGTVTIPTKYKTDPFGAAKGSFFKIKVRHNGDGAFRLTKLLTQFTMDDVPK